MHKLQQASPNAAAIPLSRTHFEDVRGHFKPVQGSGGTYLGSPTFWTTACNFFLHHGKSEQNRSR